MSDDKVSLAQLRQEIDDLDDNLHDLLMRRTQIVRAVAAAKALASGADKQAPHGVQALAMRPGREAAVIRRLVSRHTGELPRLVIASLWRELMTAKTRLQAPLRVCVYGGQDQLAFWDLARFYYGSPTPLESIKTCAEVLARVRSDASMIGILPQPSSTDFPWWTDFRNPPDGDPIHVIARLPFLLGGGHPQTMPTAYVIGPIDPEETGNDSTLIRLELTGDQADAEELLRDCGLKARFVAQEKTKDSLLVLAEIAGFLVADAATLSTLSKAPNCRDVTLLGAFANPLSLSDSNTKGDPS